MVISSPPILRFGRCLEVARGSKNFYLNGAREPSRSPPAPRLTTSCSSRQPTVRTQHLEPLPLLQPPAHRCKRTRRDEFAPLSLAKASAGASVVAFMLGGGNLPGAEMARIFVESIRSMERALRSFDVPFIASISRSCLVSVLWADGAWLRKPKELK